MPSLCSIPEDEGEGEASGTNRSVGNTESPSPGDSVEVPVSQAGDKGPESSSTNTNTNTNATTTATTTATNTNTTTNTTNTTTPGSASKPTRNRKKRKVTPTDDSGSKQKQQKKINQMTLSSFFNKADASTPSKPGNCHKSKKASLTETTAATTAATTAVTAAATATATSTATTFRDSENRALLPDSTPRNPAPETTKTDVEIINLDSSDDNDDNDNDDNDDIDDDNNNNNDNDNDNNKQQAGANRSMPNETDENQESSSESVEPTPATEGKMDSSAAKGNATRAVAMTTTTTTTMETNAREETETTDSSLSRARRGGDGSVESEGAATKPSRSANAPAGDDAEPEGGGDDGDDDDDDPSSVPVPPASDPGTRKSQRTQKEQNKSKNKSKPKPTAEPSATAAPAAAIQKTLSGDELTGARRELLRKYASMKDTYLERAEEVVARHRNGFREETVGTGTVAVTVALSNPIAERTELKTNEAGLCEDFPALVVGNMALIVEGSDLPLSRLVSKVWSDLKNVHGVEWSEEAIAGKIKLLARRKAYLDPIQPSTDAVDLFENDDKDRLWRWEVTTLELLPSDFTSSARKARAARKKASSHHSALSKLVKSLEDMEQLILDPHLPKLDAAKAKVSRDEEKVLKFERDAEKQRLADEAKARKLLEQEAKKKAKEEALEAKKRAKEEALEAKKRKKEEAARAREDEKRKKEEEKSRRAEEKKLEERKKLETVTKQKASFRSFFAAAPKKAAEDPAKKTATKTFRDDTGRDSFDAKAFRATINASKEPLEFEFAWNQNKRSASAVACRKRRTKQVAVTVYKTVEADGTVWGASDYLEQTTIRVPNKYRFLSFHGDCRPPYRGTWTKKSAIVTGKTPFRKDTAACDYDYDSEAEWEEGDEEMGENVDDDSKNDEDEADMEVNAKVYDFEDGFCVADDRLLDNEEDADEDTKALYKKKMQSRDREEQQNMHSNRIRIIAPAFGGIPLHLNGVDHMSADRVEGYDVEKASTVLCSYQGIQLSTARLCVDAFPQLHMNQESRPDTNANGDTSNKDDYSTDAMVELARFVHHSTLTSKDKMIEELRASSPTLFSNRAKATRKLDAIAVKKKHPKYSGVYWEVKTEILKEFGLTDLVDKKVEDIVYEDDVPEKSVAATGDKKSKKVSKGNLPSPKTTEQDVQAEASGSASKKRKANEDKETPEHTNAAKKKKPNEGRGSGKKESPNKKDACAGMKNLMAQFVKRSPAKATMNSPNSGDPSSKSQ